MQYVDKCIRMMSTISRNTTVRARVSIDSSLCIGAVPPLLGYVIPSELIK